MVSSALESSRGVRERDSGKEGKSGILRSGGSIEVGVSLSCRAAGLWRQIAGVSEYLHGDLIGTTRSMSLSTGLPDATAATVYTAFGERLSTANPRYGFAGAWQYQAHSFPAGSNIPFLHLGHRYYDPASGRFLQRDPIGLLGGKVAYNYARSTPTGLIDPSGLQRVPVKGIDVPKDYPGELRWPIIPPPAPATPWYLPDFRIGPPQLAMCAAAAIGGYVAGRIIDKIVEDTTGESLSDRFGGWMHSVCPSCFSWGLSYSQGNGNQSSGPGAG